MRLKIPFFRQTSPTDCGPSALRMVLAYFGKDEGIEVLKARTGIKEGKGVSTIQIATVAVSFGYRADFYSKYILFNEENRKLDFYKKYSDMDVQQSKKLVADAKSAGVNVQERALSSEELLAFVTRDSVPIVLIDWNVVQNRKEEGYQGHFVPLVGFDEQNVYIHNHGPDNTQAFMPISRPIFNEARKAKGTDEDVAVVYRK